MPLDTISTSARAELIRLNQEIEPVTVARDQAQAALSWLERPAQLLEEAIAEHAAEKAANDARLLEWYSSGCIGERPATPPSLLLAEHRLGEAHRDIGASTDALETARKALDEANVRLGSLLAAAKQSAVYRSVVEAAQAYLRERCIPAMITSLMELGVVEALAAELRGGGAMNPEALSAARAIEQAMFETRSSVAVRGDMAAAKAFLAELAGNPMAEIPAPQQTEVVHLDPPVIRPLEDGSVHINRGIPKSPAEPAAHIPFLEPLPWATVEATQ